jgi:hypothetical protein
MTVPHRARALAAAAVLGVALLAVTMLTAPAAGAAGVHYVALGDSYSAGVGSGSYIASSGSCSRSTKAYPQLWANANSPESFFFMACSGAKTTDVINSQLSPLDSSTTLVSISIGGNDVNFAGVMEDCNLYGTSTCVSDINNAENQARTVLPGKLDAVYTQIRSRAPNAHVVVLDYPEFYDLSHSWYCIGLSGTSRSKINEGADVLDGVTATEAGKYGFSFADVRSRFAAGHEICDSSSWMHSVDWSNITQSYHPTASGQSGGYLPAFSAG